MPICFAAARVRSTIRLILGLIRSLTFTTTLLPFRVLVTLSQVPILYWLLAQVNFFWLKISPLAVRLPLKLSLYQLAMPVFNLFSFFVGCACAANTVQKKTNKKIHGHADVKNARSFIVMAAINYANKIEKNFLGIGILLSCLCSCAPKPHAIAKNEYGLQVIAHKGTYKQAIENDSSQRMVSLNSILKPATTSFYYATEDNFTKQILYIKPAAYLRLEAAMALKKVQDTLQTLGYDIKIFDAYRPYAVTKKMWAVVPDDRYAANPANGSGHNRGVAVDLTIIDVKTGSELQMPTPYDSFSDTAHHNFMALPKAILNNRALLKQAMEQYGFLALDTEWWHYSLPQPKKYGLLDLSFKDMRRVAR